MGKDVSAEVIPLTGDENALVCLNGAPAEEKSKKKETKLPISGKEPPQSDVPVIVTETKSEEPVWTSAMENAAQKEKITIIPDTWHEEITPEWIEWAKKKADWFDPIIAYEDEYLGKREHGKSKEEKDLNKSQMRPHIGGYKAEYIMNLLFFEGAGWRKRDLRHSICFE